MTQEYSLPLRLCHWITALLVALQFAFALVNALVYTTQPALAEALVQAHLSTGAVVLVLTLLRVRLRALSPIPPRPAHAHLRRGAAIVHALIYVCLIALPLSGYVRLAALDFEVFIFGSFALPSLGLLPRLAVAAAWCHTGMAVCLLFLLIFHISAAFGHRLFDGQPILQRMHLKRQKSKTNINSRKS